MSFLINGEDIKKIIDDDRACIVTNRILVDGAKVGYMYREEPSDQYNDSGWRFFAGDESEEYCNTPENYKIVKLNTLCNYDDSVISKLDKNIGEAYKRNKSGKFIKDRYF